MISYFNCEKCYSASLKTTIWCSEEYHMVHSPHFLSWINYILEFYLKTPTEFMSIVLFCNIYLKRILGWFLLKEAEDLGYIFLCSSWELSIPREQITLTVA